jgi:dUTP pyrophosphatase
MSRGRNTMLDLKFQLFDGGVLPVRKHDTDAGYDVASIEDLVVPVAKMRVVRTGVRVALPKGYEIDVRSRSGLARKHQVFVLNSPGTIDAGYRGDIEVMLFNLGDKPFSIAKGDRIAQLVPIAIPESRAVEVATLDEGERGTAGFGSTGVK